MGGMLQPKDKDRLNGYKTRCLYMLSTPQNKGHVYTQQFFCFFGGKYKINFVILTIFKCTVQWH